MENKTKRQKENLRPSPAVEGKEFIGLNYCLLASIVFQVIAQLFPVVYHIEK